MENKSLPSLVLEGGSQQSPFLTEEKQERPMFFGGGRREKKTDAYYYYLMEKTREDKKERRLMEGSEERTPLATVELLRYATWNAFSKMSFLRSEEGSVREEARVTWLSCWLVYALDTGLCCVMCVSSHGLSKSVSRILPIENGWAFGRRSIKINGNKFCPT